MKHYSFRSPWDDPNVKQALKEGRGPGDIAVLCCERCANFSYYNQGSHFTCGVCGKSVSGRNLDALAEEIMTLADVEGDDEYPV